MDPRVKKIILDRDEMPQLSQADATAAAEKDFEATAMRLLQHLYPTCFVVPFKAYIRHNDTGWRPDLALVDKRWGYWFLIEVETVNHSFVKHVLPQVMAFRDGEHTDESWQRLSESLGIDPRRAKTLVSLIPQYVAVVSNADNLEWERKLSAENIQFMSIASFKDADSTTAYYVTGSLRAAQRSAGFGMYLASWDEIRLEKPENWKEQTYRITDSTGTANWECVKRDGMAFLSKKRGLLKLANEDYVQFISQDDGTLQMRTLRPC